MTPEPTLPPAPAGRDEPPVEVLFGRWLFLGCAATVAVLAAAFLAFGGVVVWKLAGQ